MTAPDPSRAVWRKSRRSNEQGGDCVEVAALWRKSSRSSEQGGQCVEVAALRRSERAIGLRDSKDPAGPVLAFTPSEWNTFLARAKSGAIDL
jgi:hypothetical protein